MTNETGSMFSTTVTTTVSDGTNFNAAFDILSKYCNDDDTSGFVEINIDPVRVSDDDMILLKMCGFHSDEENSSFCTFLNTDEREETTDIDVNSVVTLTQTGKNKLLDDFASKDSFYVYVGMIPNKPGRCLVIGSSGRVYTDFRTEDVETVSN